MAQDVKIFHDSASVSEGIARASEIPKPLSRLNSKFGAGLRTGFQTSARAINAGSASILFTRR